MAYLSQMTPAAKKAFDKLPTETQVHVATAVQALSADPRPARSSKAKKQPQEEWESRRLPVDDVVLHYDVDDAGKVVLVLRIR